MHSIIPLILASVSLAFAIALPRGSKNVTLAVGPVCGRFGGIPKDVKAGLPSLPSFSTIVAFGDSYTDGGRQDGSPLDSPVLNQPNPRAGGRYSNGPVWVEYLADAADATLKDYATNGAVVDSNQWPNLSGTSDLLTQANTFIGQPGPRPAPVSTLYILFFGIEDYVQISENGGTSLSNAAQNIAWIILRLSSSPVFGKNFLVVDNHGRGSETPVGAGFKEELFQNLGSLRSGLGLNIAFVDLSTIWNGVLGSTPGYEAFGYTSIGACLASNTSTVDSCSDPDHAFYWFPGTPTTATHKVISDYVQAVWTQC